jgi:hypothetical protein
VGNGTKFMPGKNLLGASILDLNPGGPVRISTGLPDVLSEDSREVFPSQMMG